MGRGTTIGPTKRVLRGDLRKLLIAGTKLRQRYQKKTCSEVAAKIFRDTRNNRKGCFEVNSGTEGRAAEPRGREAMNRAIKRRLASRVLVFFNKGYCVGGFSRSFWMGRGGGHEGGRQNKTWLEIKGAVGKNGHHTKQNCIENRRP